MILKIRLIAWMILVLNQGIAIFVGKDNQYMEHHIENRCFSNETIRYFLEKEGLHSAAKIYATSSLRTSGDRKCEIIVKINSDYERGLVVTVKSLKFRSSNLSATTSASKCPGYIRLFLDGGRRVKTLCEVPEGGETFSTWLGFNTFHMLYSTTPHAKLQDQSDFLIILTVYKKPRWFGCNSNRFRCANEICVWSGFKCDGYDNCGDNSDEMNRGRSNCYNDRRYYCGILSIQYKMDCDAIQRLPVKPIPVIDINDISTRQPQITTQVSTTVLNMKNNPSTTIFQPLSTEEQFFQTESDTSKNQISDHTTVVIPTGDFDRFSQIFTSTSDEISRIIVTQSSANNDFSDALRTSSWDYLGTTPGELDYTRASYNPETTQKEINNAVTTGQQLNSPIRISQTPNYQSTSTVPYSPRGASMEPYSTINTSTEPYSTRSISTEPYSPRDTSIEPHSLRDTSIESYYPRSTSREPYSSGSTSREPYYPRSTSREPYSPRSASREPYSSRSSSRESYYPRSTSKEPYSPRSASSEPYSSRITSREPYYPRSTSREPYSPRRASREPYSSRSSSRESYYPRSTSKEPYSPRSASSEPYSSRSSSREPYSLRKTSRGPYSPRSSSREPYSLRSTSRELYYPRSTPKELYYTRSTPRTSYYTDTISSQTPYYVQGIPLREDFNYDENTSSAPDSDYNSMDVSGYIAETVSGREDISNSPEKTSNQIENARFLDNSSMHHQIQTNMDSLFTTRTAMPTPIPYLHMKIILLNSFVGLISFIAFAVIFLVYRSYKKRKNNQRNVHNDESMEVTFVKDFYTAYHPR